MNCEAMPQTHIRALGKAATSYAPAHSMRTGAPPERQMKGMGPFTSPHHLKALHFPVSENNISKISG